MNFLPPPVTPSEVRNRSPRADGKFDDDKALSEMKNHLPPPVTQSDEEPIAAGGWSF